ncbi:MAG: ParB/RepB/Spo0J family partition protein [Opitutaceae bacterium]|nr:ParB/RepB/Spo0J family partition protein [Opitutaceae bacterium]
MQWHHYPLNQLCLARPQPRTAPGSLALEKSISQNGITFPVIVHSLTPHLHEVIDGEIRVFTAKLLHERGRLSGVLLTIPCLVVEAPQSQDRALWRLMANMHHGLPEEEIEELCAAVGVKVGPRAPSPPPVAGTQAPRIDDLLFEMGIRRHSIRSAQRVIGIIEVIRDFCAAQIPLPDAVEALRRSCNAGD